MNSEQMRSFTSQTKLMLTGEYLVLKGALSLALPLKFTQKLSITEHCGIPSIEWESKIFNDLWLSATLLLPDFQISETNNPDLSATLVRILKAARLVNPNFLDKPLDYQVVSGMDFDPVWGIGSSSSLISNIAYWADCDPFELNNLIFNGSGYDIACARSLSPIIYEIIDNQPSYREANFHPDFADQLYFVYLNRKQNSRESIRKLDLSTVDKRIISEISELTLGLEAANNLETFQLLLNRHERIIGNIIQIEPVKSMYFNDFKGSVKSLGAWGGDYILAVSDETEEYVRNYFINKNLKTIFRYSEMVLDKVKEI